MNSPSRRFPLQLPEDWTPQQALAVYQLLNDLADSIWNRYEISLIELLASEPHQDEASQPDLFDFDDTLPF